MSSAQILMYVAIGLYTLAGICVIMAIVIFFKLDIRGVIGDLTGKTVAREVQSMRAETKQSEENHDKMQIPHGMTTSTNLSKSKLIDKRRKAKEKDKAVDLSTGQNGANSFLQDDGATSVLTLHEEKTTLLSQNEVATTLLSQDEGATTLLSQDEDATTVLAQNGDSMNILGQDDNATTVLTGEFKVCGSVIVIHTDEVIV